MKIAVGFLSLQFWDYDVTSKFVWFVIIFVKMHLYLLKRYK